MDGHLIGLLHVAACEESAEDLQKLFKSIIFEKKKKGRKKIHYSTPFFFIFLINNNFFLSKSKVKRSNQHKR